MRFELMVGISHTTLPTSHLKPLGQVSMLNYLTHFRLLCQLPFVKKMNFLIAWLLFTAGNERARKKHDVRISLLILHRVVSFLQL